jgi:hypothetical protein
MQFYVVNSRTLQEHGIFSGGKLGERMPFCSALTLPAKSYLTKGE